MKINIEEILNKEIDISKLLVRFALNKISSEEYKIIEIWAAKSESNRNLLIELEKSGISVLKREFDINIQEEWEKFEVASQKLYVSAIKGSSQNKKSNLSLNVLLRYVAILILPITIVLFFYLKNTDICTNVYKPVVISKCEGISKLILSTGKVISLTSDLDTNKIDFKCTINKINKLLNYKKIAQKNNIIEYNELVISKGGEYKLILSDGTKVWLNSETKIKYPVIFKDDIREVELEGEAYFEVAKNEKVPFVVRTKDIDIRVLGTSFDVMAYNNENSIKTTLLKGCVEVSSHYSKRKLIIKPNEQVVFNVQDQRMNIKKVNSSMYSKWKDGLFVFHEERLEDIVRQLKRWYNINVVFRDLELKDYKFSGKLPRFENCNKILDLIAETTNIEFEIINNDIVIKKN